MDITKPHARLTRKTIFLPIIGLVAFFLYVLLFNVDILQIIATAQKADPLIYSVAILVGFAEIFFYALSWRAILGSLKVKISIIRAYLYSWYGIFLDIVIPAESISGELCRIYLVNREQSGTSGKTVASLVTQRIIGMGINVIMLALGLAFLFNTVNMDSGIFFVTLLFTVGVAALMALLLLVSWKEKWSQKIISTSVRLGDFLTRGKWKQKLATIKQEALSAAKTFHDSMKEFGRNPKTLIVPTVLLILNWICSLAVPYLVFLSLGREVPWTIILITSSIVIAVKSIPVGIPFEVGLPEITMSTMYVGFGIPNDIAVTSTILSRLITLWLRAGIGFAAQQWVELKILIAPKTGVIAAKT
jgi:uncharacterized protein (TIRG00374 family)